MRELNKMELKFLSISNNEAFARSTVAAFCLGLNPSMDELTDIKTAVSEAVTNCVVHAYPDKPGMITMQVVLYSDYVDITISDEGIGIEDLNKAREPFWTSKPGGERSGMGFTVMESFMSSIDVSKNKNKGITINMKKYLTKESVAEG
jgi:stage II sporulation protein AB (anti-sigma F factor)